MPRRGFLVCERIARLTSVRGVLEEANGQHHEIFQQIRAEANELANVYVMRGKFPPEPCALLSTYVVGTCLEKLCAKAGRVHSSIHLIVDDDLFRDGGYRGPKERGCGGHDDTDEELEQEYEYSEAIHAHKTELRELTPALRRYAFVTARVGMQDRARRAHELLTTVADICRIGVALSGAPCIDDPYVRMDRATFWRLVRQVELGPANIQGLTAHFRTMSERDVAEDFLIPLLYDLQALVRHLPNSFVDGWQDEEMTALKAEPDVTRLSEYFSGKHRGYLKDIYQCLAD